MPHTISITVYPDPSQPPTHIVKGIPWFPGITVIEAMAIADAIDTANLIFRAVFASLFGAFIDSINGLTDQGNNYWMLYIDGTAASVGASESILIEEPKQSNIDIEWKYEAIQQGHPRYEDARRKAYAVSSTYKSYRG